MEVLQFQEKLQDYQKLVGLVKKKTEKKLLLQNLKI